MSQFLMITLLLLLPTKVTATHDTDLVTLRSDVIQIEVDTRAFRQKKSGRGL